MSWDEAMLSNEEIKPVAFSIVELCLAEGISVSELVSIKFGKKKFFFKIHNKILEGIIGLI